MDIKLKQFVCDDIKSESTPEGTYITGYANTKNKADAYGDIPTNINGNPVYDLSRYKLNPVLLVDHMNKISSIFGVAIFGQDGTKEDEKGLYVKFRLMDNPVSEIARHAVEAYKNGFARTFSIAGEWAFDDPKNKSHLTGAYIHEISGVAVPADPRAVSNSDKPKSLDEDKAGRQTLIEELIGVYRKTLSESVLNTIQILKNKE